MSQTAGEEDVVDRSEHYLSIHPGHFFLIGSLPLLYNAYRGYRNPAFDDVALKVLKRQSSTTIEETISKVPVGETWNVVVATTDDSIRRAVGSAVAGRALRVATFATTGIFCLGVSFTFYAFGWNSTSQAISETKRWARTQRNRLDSCLGIKERIDENHPEYLITKNMTENEEYAYISKTYFPEEEWGPDETDEERPQK